MYRTPKIPNKHKKDLPLKYRKYQQTGRELTTFKKKSRMEKIIEALTMGKAEQLADRDYTMLQNIRAALSIWANPMHEEQERWNMIYELCNIKQGSRYNFKKNFLQVVPELEKIDMELEAIRTLKWVDHFIKLEADAQGGEFTKSNQNLASLLKLRAKITGADTPKDKAKELPPLPIPVFTSDVSALYTDTEVVESEPVNE